MNIITEGKIKGSFNGFRNKQTVFEFVNGKKWQQDEHKIKHVHAHMPMAQVTEESGLYYLSIASMGDKVKVKKVN